MNRLDRLNHCTTLVRMRALLISLRIAALQQLVERAWLPPSCNQAKAHKLTYQGMPGVLSLHGSEPLFSSLASALRLLRRTARGGRGGPGARQRLCCCCRLACAIAFGALQLLLQDSQRLLVLPGLCGCGHVCRAGGGLRDGEQR